MRFVIPEVVVSQFHLRTGETVADFGAGSGFFVPVLSQAVGPEGKVHALDIQKVLVEKIGALAHSQGLENVVTKWCDLEAAEGSGLPAGSLDMALVANSLYMVEDKPAFITEALRSLRTGGKLLVIDWTDTETGLGPTPDRLITKADCIDLCESHGCILDREFPAGEHHYGLAFRKA